MGASPLIDVDRRPVAPKPKKERERIELIEVPPEAEWFVQATDPSGRRVWFLRFQVTGLRPRRYGPFATKHKALLFLDRSLDALGDEISGMSDLLERYQIKGRRFAQHGGHYPVVEDELIGTS